MSEHKNVNDALEILVALGFPRAQQNERSALCLLALANVMPGKPWRQAENPLIGITPMMEFSRDQYGAAYKPNTRETFRRQTVHQFVAAGMAIPNPDNPLRPVNSPKFVYQIEPEALALLRTFGTTAWAKKLAAYLSTRQSLTARYAKVRDMNRISIKASSGVEIQLSPGEHSELIKAIIEDFGPRFVPGGLLVYVGDTGDKWGYFDVALLSKLGVAVNSHGKMPDVVLYCSKRNWLLLIESVTSHGPVNGKRHEELARLFSNSSAGLVYVTAFPSRSLMARYVSDIAWETEVWVAEASSHLRHFTGERFLGPYGSADFRSDE